MEIAAILQILNFAIAEGPVVYGMVTKLIAGIQTQFTAPEERIEALQSVLALLTPMEKEA